MARLPVVGSDSNAWGSILNSFLTVSHNTDGTLQSSAISQADGLTTSTTAGGDLSGAYPNPTVVNTHLSNPLTIAQGGTGSGTQNFVDLSSTAQQKSGVLTVPVVDNGGQVFNVKAFGALGNGSNDDTAAIQNAINAGSMVFLPAGTYKTTASITIPANSIIMGAGWSTVISPASNYGDVFVFQSAANSSSLSQLAIIFNGTGDASTSTPSTHAAIKFTIASSTAQQTWHVSLSNLNIVGMGQAIFTPWTLGTSLNYAQYYDFVVRNIRIRSCNIGLFINGLSDSRFEDIDCQNVFGQNASLLQTKIAPISTASTPSNTYATVCQNLINDLGNSVVNKFEVYGGVGDGIVFQDCVTTHVTSCETGTINGNGATMLGCNTQFTVIGLHSALNSGAGVYVTSDANNTQECSFIACRIDSNNKQGINATPTGGSTIGRIRMIACDVIGNSQSPTNTYDGILYTGQDLEVIGGAYGDYQSSPTQKSGINANTSGSDYISIANADIIGNVSGTIAVSGTHVLAYGCRGLNFSAFNTYTPGVPATGSSNAIGNGNAYAVTIYMAGQSGTHIIDMNGADVTLPSDPLSVQLGPNEKIYFGTTAPSSWKWYGV